MTTTPEKYWRLKLCFWRTRVNHTRSLGQSSIIEGIMFISQAYESHVCIWHITGSIQNITEFITPSSLSFFLSPLTWCCLRRRPIHEIHGLDAGHWYAAVERARSAESRRGLEMMWLDRNGYYWNKWAIDHWWSLYAVCSLVMFNDVYILLPITHDVLAMWQYREAKFCRMLFQVKMKQNHVTVIWFTMRTSEQVRSPRKGDAVEG